MKSIPMRRCVGCMTSKPKKELVRIVSYEGELSVDFTGKAKGRGVYVCPDPECIDKAEKRKALQRSLKVEIEKEQLNQIFEELREHEENA